MSPSSVIKAKKVNKHIVVESTTCAFGNLILRCLWHRFLRFCKPYLSFFVNWILATSIQLDNDEEYFDKRGGATDMKIVWHWVCSSIYPVSKSKSMSNEDLDLDEEYEFETDMKIVWHWVTVGTLGCWPSQLRPPCNIVHLSLFLQWDHWPWGQ